MKFNHEDLLQPDRFDDEEMEKVKVQLRQDQGQASFWLALGILYARRVTSSYQKNVTMAAFAGIYRSSAIKAFQGAVHCNPLDGKNWQTLGDWLLRDSRPHDAIEALEKALGYLPNDEKVFESLVAALKKGSATQKLIQALDEWEKTHELTMRFLFDRIDALLDLEVISQAQDVIAVLLQRFPDLANDSSMAEVYFRTGRKEEALKLLENDLARVS